MIDRQKSQTGIEILYEVQRHIVSRESDQISIFVFLKHSPSLRRPTTTTTTTTNMNRLCAYRTGPMCISRHRVGCLAGLKISPFLCCASFCSHYAAYPILKILWFHTYTYHRLTSRTPSTVLLSFNPEDQTLMSR